MHNLDPVPIRDPNHSPACPRRDLPISLHRHPVALQLERLHQLLQTGAAGKRLKRTGLAVQYKRKWHKLQPIAAARSNQTAIVTAARNIEPSGSSKPNIPADIPAASEPRVRHPAAPPDPPGTPHDSLATAIESPPAPPANRTRLPPPTASPPSTRSRDRVSQSLFLASPSDVASAPAQPAGMRIRQRALWTSWRNARSTVWDVRLT
jgi:hypothetical protein